MLRWDFAMGFCQIVFFSISGRKKVRDLRGALMQLHLKVGAKELLTALALCVLMACSSPEEKAKAYYESGQGYLAKKDYIRAALEFRNALKIKQDYADAWFGMAKIEEHNRNWNLVAGDLKKALELDPKHRSARTALARLMLLGNAYEEALREIEAGLEQAPNDPGLLALKSAALLRTGKASEAIEVSNRVLAAEPGNIDALLVLATERLGANDFEKAQEFISKGMSIDPHSLGLQLFALTFFEKKGDLQGQEATLRKMIAIDPDQPAFSRALVILLSKQKRFDDAQNEIRAMASARPMDVQSNVELIRLIVSFPGKGAEAAIDELNHLIASGDNVPAYKAMLAQLLFELGQTDQSLATLKEVIAEEGISEPGINARLDLAAKLVALQRNAEAEPLVEEALANDEKNVEGLRQRAAIKLAKGELDSASADLREALNEAPSNPSLYQMMANINERSGSIELAEKNFSDALRVSKYNTRIGRDYAQFLVRRGQAERAESVLSDLFEMNPSDTAVMGMLADLKLRRQDWSGAQQLADAMRKEPGSRGLANQISAAALLGQDKLDDGIKVLLERIAAEGTGAQTRFTLVRAYLKGAKYQEAEDYLKAILVAEPNNAEARTFLGIVQLNTNRNDLARLSFEAAVASDPSNALGYRALADLYSREGEIEKAKKVLNDGLTKRPGSPDLQLSLATLYERSGEIDSAISLYEDMLQKNPGSMIAANNYASLVSDYRTDSASLEKAAAAAAILRGSPIPQFKDTLGWLHYLRGEKEQALELLKQSTADLPDMALTNYHLGMAYAANGDMASARSSLERALKHAHSEKERSLIEAALNGSVSVGSIQ